MVKKQIILKTKVNVTSLPVVLKIINNWVINSNNGKYISLFNVHMCMEAYDDNYFLNVVNSADLVLADGFPIYYAQKLLGNSDGAQIRGADLTIKLTKFSDENNIPIGFMGGTEKTLNKMCNLFYKKYHVNNISYSFSPPFRELSKEEKNNLI